MTDNEIKPEIEVFDLSHIFQASNMFESGLIKQSPYVQFVLGIKNAMPVDKDVFDFYLKTIRRLLPKSEWCAAGIGRYQRIVNEWCIRVGGHTRTGMEDNVRIDKDTIAPSNASLVKIVVDLCNKYERPVANFVQTREILGLRPI